MLTTLIISLLALIVGWKAGRSYSQGEGILKGYQVGYRDGKASKIEDEYIIRIEEHHLN